MKDMASIAMLYTVFALIAMGANLGSQMLFIWLYQGTHAITVSILAGTAVGLILKYLLDKRYIFVFETTGLGHDSRLFILYTCVGMLTTALFWGIEYTFHLLFATDTMRYLGGAIGLTLGYLVKYQLDKRFVFVQRSPVRSGAVS